MQINTCPIASIPKVKRPRASKYQGILEKLAAIQSEQALEIVCETEPEAKRMTGGLNRLRTQKGCPIKAVRALLSVYVYSISPKEAA